MLCDAYNDYFNAFSDLMGAFTTEGKPEAKEPCLCKINQLLSKFECYLTGSKFILGEKPCTPDFLYGNLYVTILPLFGKECMD